MKGSLKVSIVIPSYGFSEHLGSCLESALSQDFDGFEVILVDDNEPGSDARIKTKTLVETSKKIWSNLVYIAHNKNKNGAAARNSGVSVARGKYIAFLDNDDLYKKDRISKCYEFIESANNRIQGVFTWVELRRRNVFQGIMKTSISENPLRLLLACKFPIGGGSNLFIKRDVYCYVGGFDTNFLRHQDYEFLVRCFMHNCRFGVLEEVLVIKNDEKYNFPDFRVMYEQKLKYLEKHQDILESMTENDKNFIHGSNYYSLLEQTIRNKDYSATPFFFKKSKAHHALGWWRIVRLMLLYFRSIFVKIK